MQQIGGLIGQVLKKAKKKVDTRKEVLKGWKLDPIDRAIIETVAGCLCKSSSDYVVVSYSHIRDLLKRYHGVDISSRSLFYRFARLCKLNYIKRVVWFTSRGRGRIQKKTAFSLLSRAVKFLGGVVKFAQRLLRKFSGCRVALSQYRMEQIRDGKTRETFVRALGNGQGLPVSRLCLASGSGVYKEKQAAARQGLAFSGGG